VEKMTQGVLFVVALVIITVKLVIGVPVGEQLRNAAVFVAAVGKWQIRLHHVREYNRNLFQHKGTR
jgi:hypothetical protein